MIPARSQPAKHKVYTCFRMWYIQFHIMTSACFYYGRKYSWGEIYEFSASSENFCVSPVWQLAPWNLYNISRSTFSLGYLYKRQVKWLSFTQYLPKPGWQRARKGAENWSFHPHYLSYDLTKPYVVGTLKFHLTQTILLSTHNIGFKWVSNKDFKQGKMAIYKI